MMLNLVIVRQKYTASGGAERFVSRAIQALQHKNGLDITLLSRRWEGISNLKLQKINPFYIGSVWRDWGFASAARQWWQQRPDVLVQSHERIAGCHIYRAGDGIHAQWLNWRKQQDPSWLTRFRLALNPYHRYVCHAERQMFTDQALRKVICNSDMVKREVQHYFQLADEKLTVIYNGVDTQAYHPALSDQYRQIMRMQWSIEAEQPVLLYVGSGYARKGVDLAMSAIVPYPQVILVVVGKDKHLSRYQKQAEKLGIGKRVRFVGPQQQVRPFYGMADAFILPTLYDPFPNVCVEALASGLPVMTSKQCGCAELLEEGKNGWVCDALDADGWQRIVGNWLIERFRWSELSQAARLSAEPLTLDNLAEQLQTLYQTMLETDH